MQIPQLIQFNTVEKGVFGNFYLSSESIEFGYYEKLERKDEKYEQYLMKQKFNSNHNYELITIIRQDEDFYYISCPHKYLNQETIILKTKEYIDKKIKNKDLFLYT